MSRPPRVGILSPLRVVNVVCDTDGHGTSVGCFVDELRKLGYIDGSNDALLAGTRDFRVQLIQWARSRRLPVVSSSSRVTADGGLASFGTDAPALGRRAAFYVHRILGGAKPSHLPVERSMIYKLSVNLKTAKFLGLEVPQSVLARADEVVR